MAYDSTSGYVVLFGGSIAGYPIAQTWRFANDSWTNVSANGASPSARSSAALSDDPADGGVLLFGGSSLTSFAWPTSDGDTWLYAQGHWNRAATNQSVHPSARFGAAMAYDASDHYVLLFGGQASVGGSYSSETWSFAYGTWSKVSPAKSPTARTSAAMAYDSGDGVTLLYGGWNSATVTDGWTYKAGNWAKVNTTAGRSPTVVQPQLAYSYVDRAVVLVGLQTSGNTTALQEWSFSQGGWELANASQTPSDPAPGVPPLLSTAPSTGGALLFFDLGGTGCSAGTTYRSGSAGWTNALASFGAAPCGTIGGAVTYDAADGYVLLFGGASTDYAQTSNATWSFSNGSWSELHPTGDRAPSPRQYASLSYDPVDGYAVLFGGYDYGGRCPSVGYFGTYVCADTWSFRSGTWTRLLDGSTHSPPARYYGTMAWDSADGYLLLTGGWGSATMLSDTWTFVGGAWTDRTANVTGSPGERSDASMTFDPNRGAVVLFGGEGSTTSCCTELTDPETYSNGTWTALNATSAGPSGREAAAFAFDPALGGDLLVGGTNYPYAASGTENDSWLLTANGWEELPAPSGSYSPLPTEASQLVYDGAARSMMLFGGSESATTQTTAWIVGPLVDLAPLQASPALAEVGAPLSIQATLLGGSRFSTLAFSGLPAGCEQPVGGHVSCTPTAAGTAVVSVSAYDPASRSSADAQTTLHIAPALNLPVLAVSPSEIDVGMAASIVASAQGGVGLLKLQLAGLPPGCAPTAGTTDQCRPTKAGSYVVTGTVTDALGHSLNASALLLVAPDPAIAGATLTPSVLDAGTPFVLSVTAALGTAPYRYTYGSLPPGCFSADLDRLVCAAATPGTYAVTATVTDSLGLTSSVSLPVTVNPPPSVLRLDPSVAQVAVDGVLQVTAIATGGTPPLAYDYQVQPGGCALADAPTITCRPTHPGYYLVAVVVTDGEGQSSSAVTGFTVNATAQALPSPLPPIPVNGTSYPSLQPRTPTLQLVLAAGLFVAALFASVRRRRPRGPAARQGQYRGPPAPRP